MKQLKGLEWISGVELAFRSFLSGAIIACDEGCCWAEKEKHKMYKINQRDGRKLLDWPNEQFGPFLKRECTC